MPPRNKNYFVSLVILVLINPIFAQEKTNDFPGLKGPYLGQKLPGLIPTKPFKISEGFTALEPYITFDNFRII